MKNAKILKLEQVASEISQASCSKKVVLSEKFRRLFSELPNERKINAEAVRIAESVQSDLRGLYSTRSQQYGAVQAVEGIGSIIAARKPGPETIVLC